MNRTVIFVFMVVELPGRSAPAASPAPPPAVAVDGGGWERLTEREKAVARLAAQAMTNQQIASRLGITTHTVNFHLRRIFTKLEIVSRVSLARWAGRTPGG
jgi:DNA-binding CsgD family transcriptional regulator